MTTDTPIKIDVHACETGFNWLLIKIVADDLFPQLESDDREGSV